MKQSRFASLLESCGNTASGFLLSLLAQWLFLPAIGVTISFAQNLVFAIFMTFVSVARSYGWRRLMEAMHVRQPLTPFMQAVIAECWRQRQDEGWTVEHDDQHAPGELSRAGAAYLYAGSLTGREQRERIIDGRSSSIVRELWDWSWEFWKPRLDDRRRDLVRGCALGIAEGDKFDRNRAVRRGRAP